MVGEKIEPQVKEAKHKGTASAPSTEVKNSALPSVVQARAPGERLMDTAPPGTYKATCIRGGPFEGNYVINGSYCVLYIQLSLVIFTKYRYFQCAGRQANNRQNCLPL